MKSCKLSYFVCVMFILFMSANSSVRKNDYPKTDIDLLQFPLNSEYLEAEFFLWGALGYGLDKIDPKFAEGGPSPIGASMAKLDPYTRDVIQQFAYQQVGHLKAIKKAVNGFPRPKLDLSVAHFSNVMNKAIGKTLKPPFNPYDNTINYLIASYLLPYVSLTGYVGLSSKLQGHASMKLVAGLLAAKSGQDAVIRTLLYPHAHEKVQPYGITVAEFTNKISNLRNMLGKEGVKDEGLIVVHELGAEGKVTGNVIAGNNYSMGYERTPEEVLRVLYGSGSESTPGGFYPKGALGRIAKSHLH